MYQSYHAKQTQAMPRTQHSISACAHKTQTNAKQNKKQNKINKKINKIKNRKKVKMNTNLWRLVMCFVFV